jgi:hypothetical protein
MTAKEVPMTKQKIRRYRKRTQEFVENHDVDEVAEQAAPENPTEARELRAAEEAGKRRAKEEDPALERRGTPERKPN